MEANLRFAGPETMETKIFGRLSAWQNWIFQRPNAVGERGALTLYGQARAAARLRRAPDLRNQSNGHDVTSQRREDPEQRRPRRATRSCSARSSSGSRTSSSGGRTWAPSGFQTTDIYLRTAISVDADGWAHFDYVKMPDYRWGIFLADPQCRTARSASATHGPAGLAGGAGRAPQRAAPAHRHPGRHRARVGRAAAPARAHRARRSTTCATSSR